VGIITDQARDDGRDLVGASFGAIPELLRFWRRCGLLPVQLGTHRNAASGAHAAVVLTALSETGRALLAKARQQLLPRLCTALPGPLRRVEPALIAELLHGLRSSEPPLSADETRELKAFVHASRSLEAALPSLHRLARLKLAVTLEQEMLDGDQCAAIIACVLQHRDRAEFQDGLPTSGAASLRALLRSAADRLLQSQ
ncbi:MAG: GNAT family N-acetyltransferase, partial [Thiohalocapsa sp.]